jgi:hypothetical protein
MADCTHFQHAIEKVLTDREPGLRKKLETLSDELEAEAKDIKEDTREDTDDGSVFVTFDIDVEMVEQTVKMHLPKVTMESMTLKMNLPQARGRDKEISYHVPVTVMVRQQIGTHPETICRTEYKRIGGVRIPYPHCETVWKPLLADVPKIQMEQRRIVFTYPEITVNETEFIVNLPKFEPELKTITFKTPSITIRDVRVEARRAEERAKRAELEFNADTKAAVAEFRHDVAMHIKEPHTKMFDCIREDILSQRVEAMSKFENPIAMLNAGIANLKNNETDDDRDQIAELERSREDMIAKSREIDKTFSDALAMLQKSQEDSLQEILEGVNLG